MSVIAFNLFVFGPDKARLGEVRSISSLQWLECYADVGEAKLVCAATDSNRSILQNGTLLLNSDRPHLLAQVQSVEINDDMQAAKMTVRARLTACRLEDRVLMHTATIGSAEADTLAMVQANLRGLPLTVAPAKGLAARYEGQISWGSVLEAVKQVAERTGLGFRVTADSTLRETFELYSGVDRTDPASPDYVGFLGDTAGNVTSVRLLEDVAVLRNVAVVAGEGQGAERVVVEADLSAGQPRRELFVNAADLSSKYTVENPDGSTTENTMTPEEYAAQLRARGLQALADTRTGSTVAAELSQAMMLFGRDYEVGDILPLRLARYGVAVSVRLTKVTLIYERTKSIKANLEVAAT